MTEKEFETITVAIKAAYPNSNVLPDKYAMKVWYRSLSDLDYHVAENAVWEHINTSAFPPSIAQIREKCADRLSHLVTDWGEAWEEVQMAIRYYGFYREEEALASLSRLTAVAVHRMGFRNLCMSENQVADRAHFQRMYEGMVKEEKRYTQLPEFVAREKELLKEQYATAIEEKSPARIETAEQSPDTKADLTPEQLEKRSRKLEEVRRRILGGESKTE